MINRRSLFLGLAGLVAAPSIVRAASLMPVRVPKLAFPPFWEDDSQLSLSPGRYIAFKVSGESAAPVTISIDGGPPIPMFKTDEGWATAPLAEAVVMRPGRVTMTLAAPDATTIVHAITPYTP